MPDAGEADEENDRPDVRDSDRHVERFRELAITGNREIRNELIVAHLALARAIPRAGRARRSGEGSRAIRSRARVMFSTFAVPTIAGELKRQFRNQWIVRVPRSLQERALDVGWAVEELTGRLGRSPTVAELARAMGESSEAVLQAVEARMAFSAVPAATSACEGGSDAVTGIATGNDEGIAAAERGMFVAGLLEHLAPREREVMRLRFFEDLTQSEIAARVGLSQMQVSRLIRSSLEKLRALAGG